MALTAPEKGVEAVVAINYEQIDTIRGVTICLIVWGHCLLGWQDYVPKNTLDSFLKIAVFETGKVSTIIFFIVAGFLLRPKLYHYTLASFCRHRLPKVYKPWISFILLFLVLSIVQLLPLRELWAKQDAKQFWWYIYKLTDGLMLYTAYWFVTTYIVTMLLLVWLREHAERAWLGIFLAAITLFYCINFYYNWVAANHAKAVLAYAFFVWLGIQLHKYYPLIQLTLKKISWPMLFTALTLSFIVSCMDAHYLTGIGCVDPYGSNRISNALVSIVFLAVLLKAGKRSGINRFQPRKTVYGIFLVHNIVIFELTFIVLRIFSVKQFDSIWMLLVFNLAFFALVLTVTYGIVWGITKTKFRWLVGVGAN